MRKGFTLIELLGVIIILSIITLIVMPPLLNEINKNKTNFEELSNEIIFTATDLYLSDNIYSYPKYEGSTYCIPLRTLIENDILNEKIYESKTNQDLDSTKTVKVVVNKGMYNKILVDANNCNKEIIVTVAYNEDKPLSSYFDESLNGNSSACTSNINGSVSNANQLDMGMHKITCEFNNLPISISMNVVNNVYNFEYTGNSQNFVVPLSGNYKIELWGAQGSSSSNSSIGGYGGYVSGNIYLNSGQNLYVYVGEMSNYTSGMCYNSNPNNAFNASINGCCSSGGGATDIRLETSENWYDFDSLKSRIMVAGGGGGAIYEGSGGAAGGLSGYDGIGNNASGVYTKSDKYFGYSTSATTSGGGGYFGGYSLTAANSSGGSSYISGHTGSISISDSSVANNIIFRNDSNGVVCNSDLSEGYNSLGYNDDTICSNHYSGYVFNNTVMIDGNGYEWSNDKESYIGQIQPDGTNIQGHIGYGYARITYLGNN